MMPTISGDFGFVFFCILNDPNDRLECIFIWCFPFLVVVLLVVHLQRPSDCEIGDFGAQKHLSYIYISNGVFLD